MLAGLSVTGYLQLCWAFCRHGFQAKYASVMMIGDGHSGSAYRGYRPEVASIPPPRVVINMGVTEEKV